MNIILSQVLNQISIIPEVGIGTGYQSVHSVFWSILEPDKQDKFKCIKFVNRFYFDNTHKMKITVVHLF